MKIWDARVGKKDVKELEMKKNRSGCNVCLKWNPKGTTIASNLDNLVSFFDFNKRSFIKHMKFKEEINDLEWDPTDSVIFICTSGPDNMTGPINVLGGDLDSQ